jgi:hypothetical protein
MGIGDHSYYRIVKPPVFSSYLKRLVQALSDRLRRIVPARLPGRGFIQNQTG